MIIAAAGYAAHLGGVIASKTDLPSNWIPISNSPLNGLDSLLSICQMPGGIPVATVTIGDAGAVNAGVLAAKIIALEIKNVKNNLAKYSKELRDKVEKANIELNNK